MLERDPKPESEQPRSAVRSRPSAASLRPGRGRSAQVRRSLVVGAIDDPAEREADALADEVVGSLTRGVTTGRVRPATAVGAAVGAAAGCDAAARSAGDAPPPRVRRSAMALPSPSAGGPESATAAGGSGGRVTASGRQPVAAGTGPVTIHGDPVRRGVVRRDPDGGGGTDTEQDEDDLASMFETSAVVIHPAPSRGPAEDDEDDEDDEDLLAAQFESGQVALSPAGRIGQQVRSTWKKTLDAYVYEGLGGGGAGFTRSGEVRKFRGTMKLAARKQAMGDVVGASSARTRGAETATSDYQQLVGGNEAHAASKATVDEQMRIEADTILRALEGDLDLIGAAAAAAASTELRARGGSPKSALKAAKAAAKSRGEALKAKARVEKDKIVGKRDAQGERTRENWSLTREGLDVQGRVVSKVEQDEVGRKSLEKAIEAPTMSAGLRTLGRMIDHVIKGPGEVLDLAIEFTIPTPTPGLVVVIKMSGTAARGLNGATTAGVATLGNPQRVELSAKFSVGVGAEAIGLKSSGTVGFFVRSGSDKGMDAALQALSYGAYQAAPGPIANLWAPKDKMTEVSKQLKARGPGGAALPERTTTERAEMWAAMVEETVFDDDTYADVGLGVDGSFGANFGVAELGVSFGDAIFSHYSKESLQDSLGPDFAGRVQSDAAAKRRRRKAAGEKSFSAYLAASVKVGIGGSDVEFAISLSGSDGKNWGVEITAGIGTPDGAATTVADKVINHWLSGLGESLKKLRDVGKAHIEGESPTAGVWGSIAQMPVDALVIFDGQMGQAAKTKIAEMVTTTGPKSTFDTAIGQTPPTGAAAQTTTGVFGASSQLLFVLTFGRNGGKWVVRFELRSKRGIEIGKGTPVTFSGSKTTRLLAVGRDGGDGPVAEVFGARLDSGGS